MNRAERLDLYLVRTGWAASRRRARELIMNGRVRLNGSLCAKGSAVASGDRVEVDAPAAAGLVANSRLKIEVLFEDRSLLVVNKPGLVPCHPLHADECDTVMNAVAAVYPETAKAGDKLLEGGLIHRLDNGTSGALMIARTAVAFTTMREAIRTARISRKYLALVAGQVDRPREITTPIAHHPKNPRKMVLAERGNAMHGSPSSGRPAFTQISPVERWRDFTLVEVRPRTGNRHQIRLHLSSLGHPLAGDQLYGGPSLPSLAPGRFWLHLANIEFESPAGGQFKVDAPLSADLSAVLKEIRQGESLRLFPRC